MIKIQIEGQLLDLPPAIAVNDDAIRRAMAPVFPQIANATLSRTDGPDGITIIKVTKQAGTKGSYTRILDHLKDSPAHVNPIFPLHQRLYRSNTPFTAPEEFFSIQGQLDQAIHTGEAELRDTHTMLTRLVNAPGHASRLTPVGF